MEKGNSNDQGQAGIDLDDINMISVADRSIDYSNSNLLDYSDEEVAYLEECNRLRGMLKDVTQPTTQEPPILPQLHTKNAKS